MRNSREVTKELKTIIGVIYNYRIAKIGFGKSNLYILILINFAYSSEIAFHINLSIERKSSIRGNMDLLNPFNSSQITEIEMRIVLENCW